MLLNKWINLKALNETSRPQARFREPGKVRAGTGRRGWMDSGVANRKFLRVGFDGEGTVNRTQDISP